MIKREGIKVLAVFPTEMCTTLIDGGTTTHHTFQTKTDHVTQQMIIYTFDTKVYLILVDEVFMIQYNFIVMIDKKLNKVYERNKMLSGYHVLIYVAVTYIFNILDTTANTVDVNCRTFISAFKVFHVDKQDIPKCPF